MLGNNQEIPITNDVGPPDGIPLDSTDVEMEEGIIIMTNFSSM